MELLKDIAGYKEEKEEISKLVRLLLNYKEYSEKGIYIPKGLVLQGPPGCGKTMFARAIAGECKIPFYSFQAESDSKVSLEKLTKIFKEAKANIPSIIYIDEIDKLTGHRFFDSDAVRTMVQFLLTELDGLQNTQGIMVIASTNFYHDLPESLVRSGRMDKKICIGYPDLNSRIEILNHYIKKHSVFDKVNIKSLALKIKGMSGADIKTLINNALIEYIDSDKTLVVDDFVKLINEMHFEDIGKRWNNKESVFKVLIHEAGHSLVSYALTGNCGSISGIKYGDSAGHTDYDDYEEEILDNSNEDDEDGNLCKKDGLQHIAMAFGGMIAEKLFYGYHDAGNYSDIKTCCNLFDIMCNANCYSNDFIRVDIERLQSPHIVTRMMKTRSRVFRHQKRVAYRAIKKYRYLIRYIVDEAMKNEDTLNAMQIHNCIEYYSAHKKEFKIKYKHYKIKEDNHDNN